MHQPAGKSDAAQRLTRVVHQRVASPANAWLFLRMLAWGLALPVLKYLLPLPALVRLVHAQRRAGEVHPEQVQSIIALSHLVCRLRPVLARGNCLERSLVAYRYLSGSNVRPQLVVGVRKVDGEVVGHVWVTVDGRPVGEPASALNEFLPVIAFDDDGGVCAPP